MPVRRPDGSVAVPSTTTAPTPAAATPGAATVTATGAAPARVPGNDGFTPGAAPAAAPVVTLTPEASAVAAVRKMRELIENGKLESYYEAAIDVGDPALKAEAMKLFESLPVISGETSPDELVAYGLWSQKPRGMEAMEKSARFLPGRQVLVETTVHSNAFEEKSFLSFKEGGTKAITYRATLAGEKGDNFLVKVDGRDETIEVPKAEVYKLNQPHVWKGDVLKTGYKTGDYTSAFMKAKVAEAAIKMDSLVAKLDFTQMETAGSGGLSRLLGTGDKAQAMSEIQRAAVKVVHDVIHMKYPKGDVRNEPGRYTGPDAGRQAVRGVGMCYEQASVMLAMLNPFREALGVDVQFISGGIYRNVKSPTENPFGSSAHGWLQLTYRPSMELRICDRTWSQPDHPADRAYSRYGDRYPASRIGTPAEVTGTDVNMTGKVSVATFDRQFGVKGQDGRENHMSNRQ